MMAAATESKDLATKPSPTVDTSIWRFLPEQRRNNRFLCNLEPDKPPRQYGVSYEIVARAAFRQLEESARREHDPAPAQSQLK